MEEQRETSFLPARKLVVPTEGTFVATLEGKGEEQETAFSQGSWRAGGRVRFGGGEGGGRLRRCWWTVRNNVIFFFVACGPRGEGRRGPLGAAWASRLLLSILLVGWLPCRWPIVGAAVSFTFFPPSHPFFFSRVGSSGHAAVKGLPIRWRKSVVL